MFVAPSTVTVGAMVRGPVGASVGAMVDPLGAAVATVGTAVATLGAEVEIVGAMVAAVGWIVESVGATVVTVGAIVARGNEGAIVGDCVRPAVGNTVGDEVRPKVGANVVSMTTEGAGVEKVVGVPVEACARLGDIEGDLAGNAGMPLKGGNAPK